MSVLSEHLKRHRMCPKENCTWEDATEEKDKNRHVWSEHRVWAEQTNYPSIGGTCDECGKELTRRDNLARHKKEQHRGRKRKRTAAM